MNSNKIWFPDLKPLKNHVQLSKKNLKERLELKSSSLLEIMGIGFKSWPMKGRFNLDVGLNHYYSIRVDKDVGVVSKKNRILCYSNNSCSLGIYSKMVRSLKLPNAYKLKGIKLHNENINLKVGKVRT